MGHGLRENLGDLPPDMRVSCGKEEFLKTFDGWYPILHQTEHDKRTWFALVALRVGSVGACFMTTIQRSLAAKS